jgi:uncharacterized protein (UPF0333 family)
MRGQSSVELLVLIAAILMTVTSLLYLGTESNESAVITQAARDGAENAIMAIDIEFGCTLEVEEVSSSADNITIKIVAKNAPPSITDWDNFRENVIESNVREVALKHMWNALGGVFPATATPVVTTYGTYDVTTTARSVTR